MYRTTDRSISNCDVSVGIGVAGGRRGREPAPPPIEMLPMTKMSQKRLLFLPFQFLFASWRTTVTSNNNIDPGGQGLFNLIFANQFKWALYNKIKWPLIQMGPQQYY